MTNPKHTDTSRSGELEKCFNLGDCAWTVRQAVRGYVARHLALIEALEAENERLRYHLEGTLETLLDAEVCPTDCVPCNEARAALGEG